MVPEEFCRLLEGLMGASLSEDPAEEPEDARRVRLGDTD